MFASKDWEFGEWRIGLTFDLGRFFSFGISTLIRRNFLFISGIEVGPFSVWVER